MNSDLTSLPRNHTHFVGIDSDGCAFDTMEIKHKECFIPNIVNTWDLQAVSKFARAAAEFVNLYSEWRGVNRFPGLVMVFDMLADWPEVVQRGYKPPQCDSLRTWISTASSLGNPALEQVVKQSGDQVLARALEWSRAVNRDIERIVRNCPPFPFVLESLQALHDKCDVMCVSATPFEALQREWQEHDIAKYTCAIAGQEMGLKKDHLRQAAGGKYPPHNILMIGDALGDLKAAQANGALFYPINPGDEAASWRRFHDEALGRFLGGEYTGAYQDRLIAEFRSFLPSTPPWKRGR
jgi:phosphoglycolate phosphatase-like HAD superfamily hydrolase